MYISKWINYCFFWLLNYYKSDGQNGSNSLTQVVDPKERKRQSLGVIF
jgi:hypothetical protein